MDADFDPELNYLFKLYLEKPISHQKRRTAARKSCNTCS